MYVNSSSELSSSELAGQHIYLNSSKEKIISINRLLVYLFRIYIIFSFEEFRYMCWPASSLDDNSLDDYKVLNSCMHLNL
jgi:hypothetical protein